jgi:hypothetical protein
VEIRSHSKPWDGKQGGVAMLTDAADSLCTGPTRRLPWHFRVLAPRFLTNRLHSLSKPVHGKRAAGGVFFPVDRRP